MWWNKSAQSIQTTNTYTHAQIVHYMSRLDDRNRYLFFTKNGSNERRREREKKIDFSIKSYNQAIAFVDEKKNENNSHPLQYMHTVKDRFKQKPKRTNKRAKNEQQLPNKDTNHSNKHEDRTTANEVRQQSKDSETERSKHLVHANKMDWPTRTYYTHAPCTCSTKYKDIFFVWSTMHKDTHTHTHKTRCRSKRSDGTNKQKGTQQ